MTTRRPSRPELRQLVELIWDAEAPDAPRRAGGRREHVLPTGRTHLAFRLAGPPLRIFRDAADATGETVGPSLVGGVRTSFYARDVSEPSASVGVVLRPGAVPALLGVPADVLAGRHWSLDDLWGSRAGLAREQLLAAGSAERRLQVVEALLAASLPEAIALHPAVALALRHFRAGGDVRGAVRQSGYSHRQLNQRFREAVGMTPKLYCRILRFQGVLRRLASSPTVGMAELALASGYADQPHLARDFRAFAGVTPGAYRTAVPESPNHLPVPTAPTSTSFKTPALGGH
ncbi:MAG: helix-turn-helix domain-containing protein [Dongiaceae bacterium]